MKTAFTCPVRVYYEDTDAGGVVYHANYLKFMERARSEWLSHLDLEHGPLAEEHDALFVVRAAKIEYLRPARLSDALTVDVAIGQVRRSTIMFHQKICRGDEVLATGEIAVVAVSASGFRPCAVPAPVVAALQPWLLPQPGD